jgi:hypothetical protein
MHQCKWPLESICIFDHPFNVHFSTGCADCHRALRFCTQPVESRGARFPALVMEYPESVTEILESWDMRAEEFYPLEKRLRIAQCVKTFPPVSIVR